MSDLDRAAVFWGRALDATEETVNAASRRVYRQLRLPDSEVRIMLQATADDKVSKEWVHIDIETDDVEAEVHSLSVQPTVVVRRSVRLPICSISARHVAGSR
ncbi:VOC family protein [Nocardia xishanensis]